MKRKSKAKTKHKTKPFSYYRTLALKLISSYEFKPYQTHKFGRFKIIRQGNGVFGTMRSGAQFLTHYRYGRGMRVFDSRGNPSERLVRHIIQSLIFVDHCGDLIVENSRKENCVHYNLARHTKGSYL